MRIGISLVLFVLICGGVKAQKKTHQDSVEVIDAAHRYARTFRLSKSDFEKFRQRHFAATSDYFNPDRRFPNVLLRDSLFVTTYRLVAFAKTLGQKSRNEFPGLFPNRQMFLDRQRHSYPDPLADIAEKDAGRFKLPGDMPKNPKAGPPTQTSDYFKPSAADATDPALITDSAYTQAFRLEAYNRWLNRKPNG